MRSSSWCLCLSSAALASKGACSLGCRLAQACGAQGTGSGDWLSRASAGWQTNGCMPQDRCEHGACPRTSEERHGCVTRAAAEPALPHLRHNGIHAGRIFCVLHDAILPAACHGWQGWVMQARGMPRRGGQCLLAGKHRRQSEAAGTFDRGPVRASRPANRGLEELQRPDRRTGTALGKLRSTRERGPAARALNTLPRVACTCARRDRGVGAVSGAGPGTPLPQFLKAGP